MELLKTLYKLHVPTGREWPIIEFVINHLSAHVPEAKIGIDSWGNLYITKTGNTEENGYQGYPTLCCHMDQVQTQHSEDFEVKIRPVSERESLNQDDFELYGWSESLQEQEGLGADDKNGVWICLKALEQCEHLKVFMSVGEEKGCWGSNRADLSFFEDSLYLIEPDCKGGEEIRTLLRGVPVASKEFEESLEAEKFGYVITVGKTTDVLPLTLSGVGVSCANFPCGYYNPHKAEEYCIFSELKKCLDFVLHTIHKLRTRYPHLYTTETREWVQSLSLNNIEYRNKK